MYIYATCKWCVCVTTMHVNAHCDINLDHQLDWLWNQIKHTSLWGLQGHFKAIFPEWAVTLVASEVQRDFTEKSGQLFFFLMLNTFLSFSRDKGQLFKNSQIAL